MRHNFVSFYFLFWQQREEILRATANYEEEYDKEALTDMFLGDRTLSLPQIRALNSIDYHSAFVFSWSSYKYKGKARISSIRILEQ